MNKPWYQSKTAWGSILLGGGMILTGLGNWLSGNTDGLSAVKTVFAGLGVILVAMGIRTRLS